MSDEADVWTRWAEAWPARRRERGEVVDGLALAFAGEHLAAGRLLDAGCGDGFYSARLRDLGHEVTGVDRPAPLLAHARAAHPDVTFLQAGLDALPFEDGGFDGVWCLTVLEWTADPLTCLRELRRVVRPGGTLIVGVLGAGNRTRDLHAARFWNESPMNGLLPWELPLLAERAGLQLGASRGVSRAGWEDGGREAMTRAMIWLFALSRAPHP